MRHSTFILTPLLLLLSFSLMAQSQVTYERVLDKDGKFSLIRDEDGKYYIIDRQTRKTLSKPYTIIGDFSAQGFTIGDRTRQYHSVETKDVGELKTYDSKGTVIKYSQTTVSSYPNIDNSRYDIIHVSGKVIFTVKYRSELYVKGDTAIIEKGWKSRHYKIDSTLTPRLFKVTRWDRKEKKIIVVKTIPL